MLFLSLFVASCTKKEDPDKTCNISQEFGGSTFSVYYQNPNGGTFLHGDIVFSDDLSLWGFSTFNDPANANPASPFIKQNGSLSRSNYETCEAGKYTFRFYFTDGTTNAYDFLLIERNVDTSFGTPIYSYLFETYNSQSGKKEYYRFYKK